MAVLAKVRSALCAARQLPGDGPTDVEDAPAPACLSKPVDDDDWKCFFEIFNMYTLNTVLLEEKNCT